MDNPVVPPSLLGAGVAQQPQPPSSMIDAIRSQGSMPAQAMQQMAPPPQANLGLAAGSGVLSALGGHPAQNPYLAQQGQMAGQQSQQQMGMARLAQRAQLAKQAQETKRQEALLKVSQELLQGDNEDGRLVGAKGLATYAKSVGLEIPQSVVQGMATKRLTPTEYNDILKRLGMGMGPQDIIKLYPNVKPQDLMDLQKVAKNPVALKAVGLQTPEERRTSELTAREKELSVWSKEKGVKLDSPVYGRMTQLARKPIDEMTDPEVQALKAQAEKDVADLELKNKMRVVQETADIQHKNRMAEIQARELARRANPAQNPELKPGIMKLQTEYANLTRPDDRVSRLKQAVALLSKEGLLPTGPTVLDFASAQTKAATKLGREDIAAAWDTLQRYGTPVMIDAERQLAGMPIGSVLRLKSVAEAEVGGIRRIPAQWWNDFFTDYESGKKIKVGTTRAQLEAMGVTPRASQAPQAGPLGGSDLQSQYNALRKQGMTPEQAKEALSKRGHPIE
jgi:uncharacterized protein (DUF433 family)